MEICITYARGRLTHLIRQAETGEDIVLTRNGVAVARLVAIPIPARVETADMEGERRSQRLMAAE
jgi:prevent-host-death family protein